MQNKTAHVHLRVKTTGERRSVETPILYSLPIDFIYFF